MRVDQSYVVFASENKQGTLEAYCAAVRRSRATG